CGTCSSCRSEPLSRRGRSPMPREWPGVDSSGRRADPAPIFPRRDAAPAPERAVERRGLGEAQQVADLGAGDRGVGEVALRRFAADLVEDFLKRRAPLFEAPLERPWARPETARESGEIHAAPRHRTRELPPQPGRNAAVGTATRQRLFGL